MVDLGWNYRTCSNCGERKELPHFIEKRDSKASSTRKICKSCDYLRNGADRRKRWQESNPEAHKRAYTKCNWRKHGVVFESDEEFEYWWNRYHNATHCEVTGAEFKDNRLDIKCLDHDHKTGRPRGVIIGWLNLALERMEDPEVYHKIGNYLEH